MVVCLAVACWQGVAARDERCESPGHSRQIATVNPLSLARPARLLTKPALSAGVSAHVHNLSGKAPERTAPAQGDRLFSDWPAALEELKQDAGVALQTATARLERFTGYNFGQLAGRLEQISSGKFGQLAAWLERLYRQVTAPPVLTPAGTPYIVDRYLHAPVYLTPEGRLKTVVGR